MNINIILLQKKKKTKKKNPVVLADVTFQGAEFEPGTFELPILTYLTIWHALTISTIWAFVYFQVFYSIYA